MYRGVRNVSFLENFAYVLNEWYLIPFKNHRPEERFFNGRNNIESTFNLLLHCVNITTQKTDFYEQNTLPRSKFIYKNRSFILLFEKKDFKNWRNREVIKATITFLTETEFWWMFVLKVATRSSLYLFISFPLPLRLSNTSSPTLFYSPISFF